MKLKIRMLALSAEVLNLGFNVPFIIWDSFVNALIAELRF